MNINTELASREIIVNIDGNEYALAEKTVGMFDKLKEIETRHGNEGYEMWIEELKVMLGEDAVKELFPDIRTSNIDRMYAIYNGVSEALNANFNEYKLKEFAALKAEIGDLADKIKPITEATKLTAPTNRTQRRSFK